MKQAIRAAKGAALAVAAFVTPLEAQDIELRSLDGSVTLAGDLISFDGAYYRIESEYGPISISAQGVSCSGPACPDLTRFVAEARIAGASSVVESLLPALLQGFAAIQGLSMESAWDDAGQLVFTLNRPEGTPAARFTVAPGTTDDGFVALLNGSADITIALREPSPLEMRASRAQHPDDPLLTTRVRVIALDALAPMVSASNPIADLSLIQIAGLFGGFITNWSVLGGPDAPISLHLLDPELGLTQAFIDDVMQASNISASEAITYHARATDLARAVERDAYAIGIAPMSVRGGGTRMLPLEGPCGYSQMATPESIRSEDYQLSAPVYLYLAPRRLPLLVRQFLDFTETARAEEIVRAAGYVDQAVTRVPFNLQGDRLGNAIANAGDEISLEDLQDLVARLSRAERLSTTLRFEPGSVDLDAPSRAAIRRLTGALEQGQFDGRRLVFIGFSDGEGSAEVNLRLSRQRAETVRDAVALAVDTVLRDRTELTVESFGEALPIACDDTAAGRAANRRVEVWLE